jgi:drug/metabolite transporter (DMT)-like permease
MAYLPTILGLLTALCWGTSDYLSRGQSKRVGYYNSSVYVHLTTFVFLLVAVPLLSPPLSTTPLVFALLAAAGAVNFFGFILLYRSLEGNAVSVVAPIAYTYPAMTTVAAVLLLGVVLSPLMVLALAAVMVGVILLSTRLSDLRASERRGMVPGVIPAVGAAVTFGAIYTVLGYAGPLAGYMLPALLLRGFGLLAGVVAAPILGQSIRPSRANLSTTMLAMGVLEAVGFLVFTYGTSLGAAGLPVIAALSGMGGAVASVYAMAFLRERLEMNQFVGVVLALAGVFALLYLQA